MYCSKCGKEINDEAVVCVHCGVPTNNYHADKKDNPAEHIVINNVNQNTNQNVNQNINGNFAGVMRKPKNKWVAFFLCLLLGGVGAHKFYEGKTLMGIVYIFTAGLFFIGIIVDLIAILGKPNPYYV